MKTEQPSAIVIKENDNVATAMRELKAGERIMVRVGEEERKVALRNDIRFLHKFAMEDIEAREHIIKYGQVIGEAIRDIRKGEHVHIHNLRSLRGQASK